MAEDMFNAYVANLFSREITDAGKFRVRAPVHSGCFVLPPDLPLWPLFVDHARLVVGQQVRHYNYTRFALEVPLAGDLLCRQRGIETVVLPGQVYLIHYGEDSSFTVGPSGFCRKIGLGFAGPLLGAILAETGLSECLALTVNRPRRFLRSIVRMERSIRAYRYENAAEFSGIAFQMLAETAMMINREQPELLARAVAVMKANLSQMLTIGELAEKLDTSSSTLESLFREHLGTSPRKYLMDLKLDKARQLLTSTELPMKQIAMNVGYVHPMHFSRWFRQNAGLSPLEFRRLSSASER